MRQECYSMTFSSLACGRSLDRLIAAWDCFAPNAGKVTCASVMFSQRIGRPGCTSLEEVRASYDRRWGRLHPGVMRELVDACGEICCQSSILDYLPAVLPEGRCSREQLGELILWAERYGATACLGEPSWHAERWKCQDPRWADPWPELRGPYPLLEAWQARRAGRGRKQPRRPRHCQRQWRSGGPRLQQERQSHHSEERWQPQQALPTPQHHQRQLTQNSGLVGVMAVQDMHQHAWLHWMHYLRSPQQHQQHMQRLQSQHAQLSEVLSPR